MEMIGRLAFYVGLAISLIAGWTQVGPTGLLALVVLGVVVGLLNVTGKEASRFLIAALVLISAGMALSDIFGARVSAILGAFITFSASAAVIVALKEVYSIEKD